MVIRSFVLGLFFIVHSVLNAQDLKLKGLQVGDQFPSEYVFPNAINHKSKQLKLSDFEDKIVILDFWSTYCSSCIASWPKLEKLQRKFSKDVQIVLVNEFQSEDIVRKVFGKREKLANVKVSLPTICGDSGIRELLPYDGLPHIVWIDRKGSISAITDGASLNERNLREIIKNGTVTLPLRINKDEWIQPVASRPLFIKSNGGSPKTIYWHSVFARADDYLFHELKILSEEGLFPYGGVLSKYRETGFPSILASNMSIADLYSLAYSRSEIPKEFLDVFLQAIPRKHIHLSMRDSLKYLKRDRYGQIMNDNLYTYQLVPPIGTSADIMREKMREDLNRYVGLKAQWQKKRRNCLVLSSKDTSGISYVSGKRLLKVGREIININNVTVEDFLNHLQPRVALFSQNYVIDETGMNGKMGKILIETNIESLDSLNRKLASYNLNFRWAEREVELLTLSEPEGFEFPYSQKPILSPQQKFLSSYYDFVVELNDAKSYMDWPRYVEALVTNVPNYYWDHAPSLSYFARDFYSNTFITSKKYLMEAIKWAERSIQLNDDYFSHDAHASLLYKIGENEKALEAAKKALERARELGWDGKSPIETQDLIQLIMDEI